MVFNFRQGLLRKFLEVRVSTVPDLVLEAFAVS
jgi:hypothetical protein